MRQTKIKGKRILTSFIAIVMAICSVPNVSAVASENDGIERIYVYDANNQLTYVAESDSLRSVSNYISSDDAYTISIGDGEYYGASLCIGSNTTINATAGATISYFRFYNLGCAKKYGAEKNITINGGVWKNTSTNEQHTYISLSHAQNITIKNCKMYGNYSCHIIELIGCKNVKIDNCTLYDKGDTVKNSVEEPLQIDIATPSTAPAISVQDGTPCRDITINKCKIRGSRGICANFSPKEPKYCVNYHYNITIKNCTIEGKTAEAVALFNVAKVTVKNNKITTQRKPDSRGYSVGLDIQTIGKKAKNLKPSKYPIVITGNTIKGGRNAICLYSHIGEKWGKATITKNKLYCKKGKSNAIRVVPSTVKSEKISSNKLNKWS